MRYTTDKWTGELICAVCGHPVELGDECCPTSPYISREEFKGQYFKGDSDVPMGIVKDFHEDYLYSSYSSLEEYIADTVTEVY